MKGILDTLEVVQKRGVELKVLTEAIDSRTTMGKFVLHILAAMVQMERDLTIERTLAGQRAARDRGAVVGRRETMTLERAERARALLAEGKTKPEVARAIGVSRAKLYNWLKKQREAAAADDGLADR